MSKKGFTLVEVLLSLSITLLIVLNCSLLVKVLKISNQSKYIDTSLENAIFSLSNELITAKNIEYGDSLSFLDENDYSHKIILQNKQNKCVKYVIEILKIENQTSPSPKTFKIKIVDEDLLRDTGGIVQGMSGTPIIQNGKIIGAVSHALENNPKVGYGVYIKWML